MNVVLKQVKLNLTMKICMLKKGMYCMLHGIDSNFIVLYFFSEGGDDVSHSSDIVSSIDCNIKSEACVHIQHIYNDNYYLNC